MGDALDAHFYLCGPGPFMDLVEQALLELGVAPDRILIERFVVPADAPAIGPAPVSGDQAAGDRAAPDTITLVLRGQTHEIAYHPGDTVLETARRAGLAAPYSCEAGNCATCMALIREGAATMRTNQALTPDEVAEGWVLTCQAVPTEAPLTIEYEPL